MLLLYAKHCSTEQGPVEVAILGDILGSSKVLKSFIYSSINEGKIIEGLDGSDIISFAVVAALVVAVVVVLPVIVVVVLLAIDYCIMTFYREGKM